MNFKKQNKINLFLKGAQSAVNNATKLDSVRMYSYIPRYNRNAFSDKSAKTNY